MQGLDYREAKELCWCPSWSNSLWQGWSCGRVYCSGGKATEPIWRVLASSDGISSWTPLKPQQSNPNPNPLADQLWCIDFLTPATPLIIHRRLPAFLESLMPLKNSCSIHARCSKSSLKHSMRFCGIFPTLQQNFLAYRSSKVSDCIFEIHQLWQSGFIRMYSNSWCSCSFEAEIIKIGPFKVYLKVMVMKWVLHIPQNSRIVASSRMQFCTIYKDTCCVERRIKARIKRKLKKSNKKSGMKKERKKKERKERKKERKNEKKKRRN